MDNMQKKGSTMKRRGASMGVEHGEEARAVHERLGDIEALLLERLFIRRCLTDFNF